MFYKGYFTYINLILLLIIPNVLFAESPIGEVNIGDNTRKINFTINSEFRNNFYYRGLKRSTRAVNSVGLDCSGSGVSMGFWYSNGIDTDYREIEGFWAFSYPLGIVDISVGAQGLSSKNALYFSDSSFELFTEIIANPIMGFIPSLSYYFDIQSSDRSYGEFKLSKSYGVSTPQVRLQPYLVIGFGDYWSSEYSFNHIECGALLNISITDRVELGYFGGIVEPLKGVENLTQSDDTETFIGARLTFQLL